MSKPVIQIENLGKRYVVSSERERYLSLRDELAKKFSTKRRKIEAQKRDFWALKDISFTIEQGDVVGIIGQNGAGKSTLLKVLSQITPPTTGSVVLRGRTVSLLEVGTGFHPELTGRENIFLNGAILGMTRTEIRQKFDEIVEFSEISRFLDTPVKRYSSGMYVRLAFAVAAHLEPEVLLVDEVLAVGDSQFQRKCIAKMGEVSKGGRTVLFVSHNMAAVRQLCSSGVVIRKGSIQHAGPISECIEAYTTAVSSSNTTILSHFKAIDSNITLNRLVANGSDLDYLILKPGDDRLLLELDGFAQNSMNIDLEMRLTDPYGSPLAFFAPGLEKGHGRRIEVGEFRLTYDVQLPRLFKGRYVASFYVTDPGRRGWADADMALTIEAEGFATASGRVFDNSSSAGWLALRDVRGTGQSDL